MQPFARTQRDRVDKSPSAATLSGGDAPFSADLARDAQSPGLVYTSPTNGLTLRFNAALGTMTGHFTDPSTLWTRIFQGVVLQSESKAGGYFRDSQSGSIVVEP